MKKIKLLFVIGTRPDALKLAPVILAAKRDKKFKVYVCLTAQHREMADSVLRQFDVRPDLDLNIMKKNQSLTELTQRLLLKIQTVSNKIQPDFLILQGDTTTAFASALAAYYCKVRIVHIEAGLRSFNKYHPYPEELNRKMVACLADYHFAPTALARTNLLREGIPSARITVTGNTIVDALQLMKRKHLTQQRPLQKRNKKTVNQRILVTAHRRESFGEPLREICRALKKIVKLHPHVEIVFPVHLNPYVQKAVFKELKGENRIRLIKPLGYPDFLRELNQADLVLTDSGGVQEEAPSFGVPVLVMRKVTERREAIDQGFAALVGTSCDKIVRSVIKTLAHAKKIRKKILNKPNPFGDGLASARILKVLTNLKPLNQNAHTR